jgi:uncharacterized membrane protein
MILEHINWIVLTLLSAVFGALALVLKKKGLEHEHSLEYLSCFKVFELIIMLPLAFFIPLNFPLETYVFMYLVSIFITGGLLFQNKAFKRMEFTKVIPLFNLKTIITLFASMIILQEFITPKQLGGAALIAFALYKIEAKHGFRETLKHIFESKYTLLFLISMVLLGVLIVFEKQLIVKTHILSYLLIMYFFGSVNSLIILTAFYDGYKGVIHGIKKEGKLIFAASALAALSNVFGVAALASAYVVLVDIVKKSSNVFAMMLGGRYFHEGNTSKRIIWTVVATAGVLLVV